MSTIKITKRFLVNGSLTDADAVVLSDSTATYGIKRHDTDEVIVAAGTAMDHESTGVYSTTFTYVPGVIYDYAVQFTRGASVYRAADQVTAPVAVNAPCYLTITEADAIAATLLSSLVASYTAAGSTQRQAALEQASADVDNAFRYQGRRYDPDGSITGSAQTLEFPRVAYPEQYRPFGCAFPGSLTANASCVWDWDDSAGVAIVPDLIKRAVVLQAADRLEGTRLAKLQQRWGLSAQTTGSLSETYAPAAGAGSTEAQMRVCPEALNLLQRYRLRSGGLL